MPSFTYKNPCHCHCHMVMFGLRLGLSSPLLSFLFSPLIPSTHVRGEQVIMTGSEMRELLQSDKSRDETKRNEPGASEQHRHPLVQQQNQHPHQSGAATTASTASTNNSATGSSTSTMKWLLRQINACRSEREWEMTPIDSVDE